jgi:hypothetical protein
MGIVGSLGNVAQAVAIATGAFMLLDAVFSKNAKETELFNKALTTSEESVSNVLRTLQAATSTEGFATKTIANTVALSNAFNELTTSAKEALKTANAAAAAAGIWDKFWNGVFSIVGQDRDSKLADSIAKQISSSIDILSREGLADEYASEIKKILNVDNLKDISAVSGAWKNLSKEQQASVLSIQDNSNRALGNASSAVQGFADKTTAALTVYKTFVNSFVDTSPLFKLGEVYIDVGQSLAAAAAAGPDRLAQAFEELATNLQKAALFGEKFANAFAPIAEDLKNQKAALDALNVALIEQVELRKNLSSAASLQKTAGGSPTTANKLTARAEEADKKIAAINTAISSLNTSAAAAGVTKLAVDASKTAIDEGLKLINKSIANARTTADIGMSKVLSSVLTGPRKLEADNETRQRELKLQLEDVKISEDLINIQSSLVDEMKLANALQAEANALQKGDKSAIQSATLAAQRARAVVGQRGDGIPQSVIDEVEKQKKENKERTTKGLESKRVAITGEMSASKLNMQLQMPGATLQQQEQLLKITDRKLAAERASLDVNTAIAGVTSTASIALKQSAEAAALKRAQESEIATINADIETREKAKSAAKPNSADATRLKAELDVLAKIKTETELAQKAESNTAGLKNRQELLTEELNNISKRSELITQQRDLENTIASGKLEYQAQELQLMSATYNMSKELVISRQAQLETQKTQLQTSSAIAGVEAELQRKRDEAAARITGLGGRDTADTVAKQKIADIDAEIKRQETLFGVTKQKLTEEGTQRLALIELAKTLNLEQERYNLLIETSTRLTESLGAVFGDVGNKLGLLSESLTKIAISTEQGSKALEKIGKDADAAWSAGKIDDAIALEEQYEKQKKKNGKTELDNNIKVISGAKALFKEKSTGYKLLDAAEKASHLMKIYNDNKELVTTIFNLGKAAAIELGFLSASVSAEAAADMTKATSKIPN